MGYTPSSAPKWVPNKDFLTIWVLIFGKHSLYFRKLLPSALLFKKTSGLFDNYCCPEKYPVKNT